MQRSISRLLMAGFAVLMTAGAAHAFSEAAVKEAQRLADMTQKRFEFGEVEATDVALARYNVLDMRLRAGQLDRAAFCTAAKPELAAVAAKFDPPDGHATEKTAWLAAVEAMAADPAKCRDATATTERWVFGDLPTEYSDAALKNARAFVATTAQRYATGDVTAVDLAAARYALIDIKHGMKAVAQGTWCQTGAPLLQEIADGTEQEAGIGQRTLAEVIAAKRRLHAVMAPCANELHADLKDILTRGNHAADKLAKKDFDGAIADYTALLRLAPQDTAVLLGRGGAYATKDDKAAADADYSAVFQLDGADEDALRARAELRLNGANTDGAIADLTALLALDPGDLEGRFYRAYAFYTKQDYPAAIADYTVAIDRAPKDNVILRLSLLNDALVRRGYSYLMLRDFDHAIADYSERLRVTGLDPAVLTSRAYAYFEKHDYAHAIADDDVLIHLDPKNAAALMQRAAAYEQLKDYERATADDTAVIALDPDNADAFNSRCWHRAIGGHLRDALPDCDQSLRLRPGDVNTLDSRGFVHLALGDVDPALADYDAALKADPKLASSLYGRGVARRRKGATADADADIAAASAIDPAVAKTFAEYGVK